VSAEISLQTRVSSIVFAVSAGAVVFLVIVAVLVVRPQASKEATGASVDAKQTEQEREERSYFGNTHAQAIDNFCYVHE
jgi:hypothetical protein